jgi:hypothetical protein
VNLRNVTSWENSFNRATCEAGVVKSGEHYYSRGLKWQKHDTLVSALIALEEAKELEE